MTRFSHANLARCKELQQGFDMSFGYLLSGKAQQEDPLRKVSESQKGFKEFC